MSRSVSTRLNAIRQAREWCPRSLRAEGLAGRDAAGCPIATMLILLAVLWLATRPYAGVVHDARFYMVQALHSLHPSRFAEDLYFKFGSQDQFTIFTKLYAPLVSALGVGGAGIAATCIGQLLWLCALLFLACTAIRPSRLAILSAALAIALPGSYGVLEYGEANATPRLFAEAVTMAALALVLRRQTCRALAMLAVAATVHPLTTLGGLVLAALRLAVARRLRCIAIAGASSAVAALVIAGVPPLANLRVVYDPAWFEVVRTRDAFSLLTRWPAPHVCAALSTLFLAVSALALARPRERPLLRQALAVGLGGLALTFVGGDLAHNVLIVELQPWRALWLTALLAHLYAAPILVRVCRRRDDASVVRFCLLVGLGALVLSRFLALMTLAAAMIMAVTAVVVIWQRICSQSPPMSSRGRRLAAVIAGIVVAIVLLRTFSFMAPWRSELWRQMYSLALVAAALGALGLMWAPSTRYQTLAVSLTPFLAVTLPLLAALGWDARTPWTRFVETPSEARGSLASLLPLDAPVYWEGGVEMLWFGLQRPSFFSCTQGTGALFFRDTAIHYQHRLLSFKPLQAVDAFCAGGDGAARALADLVSVCRREPALDYLVLARPVEDAEAKVWTSPVPFQDVKVVDGGLVLFKTDTFYIYSCRDF
jgi:hypothetical protein